MAIFNDEEMLQKKYKFGLQTKCDAFGQLNLILFQFFTNASEHTIINAVFKTKWQK